MPEGSIAFPNEPLLRVTAPFREAILLESGLLQAVNLATLIATKASRIVWAAQGRPVSEFALRRAQEPYVVSRSARIGGCWSTSFLAAAAEYRLLASGTIPHALVQLFEDERERLRGGRRDVQPVHPAARHLRRPPGDPHGRRGGADRTARATATSWRPSGWTAATCWRTAATSGACSTRPACRTAGSSGSGDLDEYSIADLVAQGAPFDAFGVGTSIGVGAGSVEHDVEGGSLGGVYKNVAYVDESGATVPKLKVAGDKTTLPGPKEVYRVGAYVEDVIQLADEPAPGDGSERLLKPVMRGGRIVAGQPAAALRDLGAGEPQPGPAAGAVPPAVRARIGTRSGTATRCWRCATGR